MVLAAEQTHPDQWNGKGSPVEDPFKCSQMGFRKRYKYNSMEEGWSFQQVMPQQLDTSGKHRGLTWAHTMCTDQLRWIADVSAEHQSRKIRKKQRVGSLQDLRLGEVFLDLTPKHIPQKHKWITWISTKLKFALGKSSWRWRSDRLWSRRGLLSRKYK